MTIYEIDKQIEALLDGMVDPDTGEVNEEVLDDATAEIGVDKNELSPVVTAEVGNIFKFGTEKSEKMDFQYQE